MESTTTAQLAAAWLAAKADEDAARAARIEIEEAIVAALPGKDEGSTSTESDQFRVVVTRKLNRSVDTDALKRNWHDLPEIAQASFRWKADLDLSMFRRLDDGVRAHLLQYVTSKPAKASVKIDLITD